MAQAERNIKFGATRMASRASENMALVNNIVLITRVPTLTKGLASAPIFLTALQQWLSSKSHASKRYK